MLRLKEKKIKNLSAVFLIALLILLFLSWLYLYNIYEVRIQLSDQISETEYTIEIEPLNSFGKTAMFRSIDFSYEVIEGSNFIEDFRKQDKSLNLKLIEHHGEVKLSIKTNKSLNSTIITIPSTN